MIISKTLFDVSEMGTLYFPDSNMGRNIVWAKITLKASNSKLYVSTSHLESLGPNSEERTQQLRMCCALAEEAVREGHVAFFGGDLNIREKEAAAALTDTKFADVWCLSGSPEAHRYTWDLSENDNCNNGHVGTYKPRFRFDRVYVMCPDDMFIEVENFKLVGRQRTKCGLFPSDHFGVVFSARRGTFSTKRKRRATTPVRSPKRSRVES